MAESAQMAEFDRLLTFYRDDTNRPQSATDGDCDPFHFVFIPPSLLGPEQFPVHLRPVIEHLTEDLKHGASVVPIANSDTTKNFDDDRDAALEVLEGKENVVLVSESRGIEAGWRAATETARMGKLHNLVGYVMASTAGPHGVSDSEERYTEAFNNGKTNETDTSYKMDPDVMRVLIKDFIEDESFRESIIDNLHTQRSASISATPLPDFPKELPFFVVQGAMDNWINLDPADSVFKQTLGRAPVRIPNASHLWLAEQPERAAKELVLFAHRAKILRVATSD